MSTVAQSEPARVPEWTVGERLKKARVVAGLERADLAEYLDVSVSLIGQFETGSREPRDGYLRNWSERCGVPFYWIKYGRESPPEEDTPGSSRGPTPTEWYDQPGLSYQRAAA